MTQSGFIKYSFVELIWINYHVLIIWDWLATYRIINKIFILLINAKCNLLYSSSFVFQSSVAKFNKFIKNKVKGIEIFIKDLATLYLLSMIYNCKCECIYRNWPLPHSFPKLVTPRLDWTWNSSRYEQLMVHHWSLWTK